MRALFLAVCLIVLAASGSGAESFAPAGGPLLTANAYPPLQPFLSLPAEDPRPIEPGRLRGSLSATYGNISHYDPYILYDDLYVIIDGEVLKLNFGLETGLPGGIGLAASLPFTIQYFGLFDSAIQVFHGIFGLPNGTRDKLADNGYAFRIVRSGTALVDLRQSGWGAGDLTLRGKWAFLCAPGDGLCLALQAALKLPTGSTERFLSNGKIDGALGLLASYSSGSWILYGRLSWLRLGEPSAPRIFEFDPNTYGFFTALEWRQTRDWSWLIQAEAATSPFRHPHRWIGELSGAFNLGLRTRIADFGLLQFSIAEEFLSYAALDISANLAVVRDF